MEDNSVNDIDARVYRTSWLGYVRPVAVFAVFAVVCGTLLYEKYAGSVQMQEQLSAPVFFLAPLFVMFIASGALLIKSYYLYTIRLIINGDGVYLFRGIFPWTKGTKGTLWKDIADAQYFPGFISWLFKSYSIQVRFRFNKSNETLVSNLWKGNEAVIDINKTLQQRARLDGNV